jgi:hypothetical protein
VIFAAVVEQRLLHRERLAVGHRPHPAHPKHAQTVLTLPTTSPASRGSP